MNIFSRVIIVYFAAIASQQSIARTHMVMPAVDMSSYQCPQKSVLDKFLSYDDLMFGEVHGTFETPAFLKCLVDFGLENTKERIIVSLEMTSAAREPMAEFWRKDDVEDGRSSKAMQSLVRHLVELEDKLLIDLHFQHRSRYFETDEEYQKFLSNRPKSVGEEIRDLAPKGKVFALAGNVHTMKYRPDFMGITQDIEGKYVGPSFTHIIIESANGGESWSCSPDCAIQSEPKKNGASKGTYVKDVARGHDYIYYLDIDGFTASEPHE
jgi:hypothetical protein